MSFLGLLKRIEITAETIHKTVTIIKLDSPDLVENW